MYFNGIDLLVELVAASYTSEINAGEEVSQQVLKQEKEEHRLVEDIVRLPLKLPFPSLSLKECTPNEITITVKVCGPDGNEEAIYWGEDYLCGRAISTYPIITVNRGTEHEMARRDGDPICDRFVIQMLPRRTIAIVADGCNWGRKPKIAAQRASDAFAEYLLEHHHEATTTHYVARLITRAFSLAHYNIILGAEEIWDVGTTTLLGGLLVELEEPLKEDRDGEIIECNWAYIWGCVGDCKGFHYSVRQDSFRDITSANRMGTQSSRDCGGRLGPATAEGSADLRNFRIDLTPCEEGDIIILVSDGVHDNLEPLQTGLSPIEVGEKDVEWEEIEAQRRAEIAADYSIYLLTNLLKAKENGIPDEPIIPNHMPEAKQWKLKELEVFSPNDPDDETLNSDEISCSKIVHRLINHCIATNRNAAIWMQENPTKKLPKDYKLYPGKMDHTTCVALRVQHNDILQEKLNPKKPKNKTRKRLKRKLSQSHGFKRKKVLSDDPECSSEYNSLEEARSALSNLNEGSMEEEVILRSARRRKKRPASINCNSTDFSKS